MNDVRPIPSDGLPRTGGPVVVVRREHEHSAVASHAVVTHSYAVLVFCTGGESSVELNGEWELRRGDVLLVPAGAAHRPLQKESAEYWGLAFCVPCFAANGAASLLEPFERVRAGAAAVVRIPATRHEYLERLLREIQDIGHEPVSPRGTLDPVQRSLLTLILAEVSRAWVQEPGRRGATGAVVGDALRFIERNCLRKLTLNDVAAAVGRSPTYVTSALTRATGRSAGQWIVSGRMAEARRLLLHSHEMVDAIAGRVGYADATHFIRMFRREHGATPAAWRASQPREG